MNARSVPVLDIGRLEHDRERFVAELGGAYREYGFCCLQGHGIPDALIDAAYAAFRAFFELPEAIKLRYRVAGDGGARGYTPYKTETARDAQHADLKEFWHIGRELPPGSPYGEPGGNSRPMCQNSLRSACCASLAVSVLYGV